jgi:prepilin-type N-terminal cleavage/methylation domain-containing protein
MLEQIREARRNQKGFTLIELLIVIVILGVLAAIVVFAVGAFNSEGHTAACKSDVKNVEIAQEAYKAKADLGNGSYAGNVDALVTAKLLREAPNSQYYAITTGTSGDVSVQKLPGGTAAVYTGTQCDGV